VDPATRQAVVAATLPLRNANGTIFGVVAAVVPINRLFQHPFLQDRLPQATRSILCYLDTHAQTGRVGVRVYATTEDDATRARNWRAEIGEKWLNAGEREPFQAMLDDFANGVGGARRMTYEGCDCLWVYGRLNQFTSFLVLITPFKEILEPAVSAQVTIEERVDRLIRFTGYGAAIVVLVSLLLALAFSKTVTRPLNALAKGALRLSEGDFGARVDIRSRDELGDMGKVFNQIGPRLKEHAQMRHSLALASEVQQTLLPQAAPRFPGLDIAGKSYNCDETGGDYFDYLREADAAGSIAVLVGDVSGHGIASALLMTTARALIRQRAAMGGGIGEIVSDVNRLLVQDIEASGRFMTLFYSRLEPGALRVCWVRAGHDPAIFYDSSARRFDDLGGKGLPLGVLDTAEFEVCERPLHPGDVLVIGTDGIWEARNPGGEMFGKGAVCDVIGRCIGQSAAAILQAVVDAVSRFQDGADREDDITLVVIKVEKNPSEG
jgi:sigma-B regulation protein RsbU (phosphoserine phosphatase)